MNLMELLPNYYETNETMKELQCIVGEELIELKEDVTKTIDQCFINSTTDLLSRYEKIYGLPIDGSKNNEFRRERLRAKARGTGTVTKKMIEEVAKSYSNCEVEVSEDPTNYKINIKFVGTKGLPPNMTDLTQTIEEIKPAHLMFTFEYVYNTWNNVAAMTWNEASTNTWEGLRTR